MNAPQRKTWVGHAALALGLILAGGPAMSLEQPQYTVVHTHGDVEYRRYDAYLVSETTIDDADTFEAAGNEGFRRLFRYISGGNSSRAKIDMTVPVQQSAGGEKIAMTAPVQQSDATIGWRVTFMLPSEYTMETAPQPQDPRVQVSEVPPRLVAALRFSGRWTDRNFSKKRQRLLESLQAEDIEPVGDMESAMYSAPFMPPFLRRNEVMIAVDRLPASAEVPVQQTAAAY